MARTRGASHSFHQDDGVLLDKEGKPVDPFARRDALPAVQSQPVPAAPVEPPKPARYLCDESTWSRSMDAFDAMLLMQVYLGEKFSVEMDAEKLATLHPNARQHFRKL
jgi:hypothetical protein